MSVSETAGGPRFVAFLNPVLEALRAIGGEGRPGDVITRVANIAGVSETELLQTTAKGQNSFRNRVAWARFYLTHAGLIDGTKRGVWRLTDEGRERRLTHAEAVTLFRDVHARFQNAASRDEDEAPPEPSGASDVCWFVGAQWSGYDDQIPRFVREGIWENGYEDRFGEKVRSMQVGERIAIKATFRRKHNLPFDNRGIDTSVMLIKATGVITGNLGDGRRIAVEWVLLPKPREWYFYTFQETLWRVEAGKPETDALIRFTFDGARQDYDWWLHRPHWASRYGYEPASSAIDSSESSPVDSFVETSFDRLAQPYDVDAIVTEGCFLSREELQSALDLLRRKKNLVLQGPPGTGKTWLAKRLGWALVGSRDPDRLTAIQFQPSLSYEDFVRGWRPSGEGGQAGLKLVDGAFLEAVRTAEALPTGELMVLVIEEINRGNPALIFGELLTLIEADKRHPGEALRLAYPRAPDERKHIPANLFIIGTMNLADRSLALVDLALRRRFGFITLKPNFGRAWRAWCLARGAPGDVLDEIAARMEALNLSVAGDRKLGEQFRVGHSFVTPTVELDGAPAQAWRDWFASVVAAEIAPLLEEYWYDDPDAARQEISRLALPL